MRVMIDTNIIISAILRPNGRTAQAFYKTLLPPYQSILCDYIVDELRRKFKEKFPAWQAEFDAFCANALPLIDIVSTPKEAVLAENSIRDPKDRPILRAALNVNTDLFLTGDKDFLESSISDPRIVSVDEYLAM